MTATVPPPTTEQVVEASRWQRMRAPVLVIGGLGLAVTALHFRDPHQGGSWGFCTSAAMGFWCPGCGGLRAVNDLTRGDVGAAASSNLLFVLVLPLMVFLLGRWAVDRWTGREREVNTRLSTIVVVSLCVAALVFTVLRNLPTGSWLAP